MVGAVTGGEARRILTGIIDPLTSVLVDTTQLPPAQVTGVVTAPTTNNTEMGVSWNIPNDNGTPIVDYSVQYREQGTSTWINFSPNPTTNTTVITGLTAGLTYEIRVAASNGILGPYSAIATAEIWDLTSMALALWLDFSDPNSLYTDTGCTINVAADGNTVACVADKSGFGRDFAQPTASARPTYRTNAINGLPGLEFDGAGDFLVDEDGELYVNGFQAYEFFVVIKSDVTGNDKGILDTKDPNGSDDGITLRYDASGASGGCSNCMKGGVERTDGTHVQSEAASGTQTTNAQIVGTTWADGGKFDIFIDGNLSKSYDGGTMSGTIGSAEKFIIGKGPKDSGTTRGWDGKIVEVIFFNTQTSGADRTKMMNYLKSKWNIP